MSNAHLILANLAQQQQRIHLASFKKRVSQRDRHELSLDDPPAPVPDSSKLKPLKGPESTLEPLKILLPSLPRIEYEGREGVGVQVSRFYLLLVVALGLSFGVDGNPAQTPKQDSRREMREAHEELDYIGSRGLAFSLLFGSSAVAFSAIIFKDPIPSDMRIALYLSTATQMVLPTFLTRLHERRPDLYARIPLAKKWKPEWSAKYIRLFPLVYGGGFACAYAIRSLGAL